MADNNTTINPSNATTGSPVEGACCYTSFEDNPTIPTDATTSISGAGSDFVNLGELSDQGWQQDVAITVQKFKGYHGKTLFQKVSGEENTFKAEFVEITRTAATKLRYGKNNVTTNLDGEVTAINPKKVPEDIVPLIFEELLSNGVKQRTVFPRAKIESIDSQAHQDGSLLVYGMTFTALVDDSGAPYHVYRARIASDADLTANVALQTLTIGSVSLTPSFAANVTSYAATTSNATNTVTATAADSSAGVVITVNGNSIASGGSATWSTGENNVLITVTNGVMSRTYRIVVTKESSD